MTTRFARLLWLERRSTGGGVVLTERLKGLLQRAQTRSRDSEAYVESSRPGYLLCQDTYYVGTIKGVGRIYSDCGEVIQRYCEEKGLGIRLLSREQLEPLFWHFEGATLNTVTGRSLPFKRRFRTWRFYRRPEVCAILADVSLDH